ncbi:MAG: hypothetical protein EOP56_18315 [Sphingobacteriales bacterium]|nr:MAG: hypothetical protein EOP56_18315 [Sphingobacteriales bacterium]
MTYRAMNNCPPTPHRTTNMQGTPRPGLARPTVSQQEDGAERQNGSMYSKQRAAEQQRSNSATSPQQQHNDSATAP